MAMINNKKGAEGGPLGIIIILGVALITAVIVILFFLGVFDVLSAGVDLVDDKVSLKVTACDNALNARNFCNYDKVGKVGSLPLYINCKFEGANFQASLSEKDKFTCEIDKTFDDACTMLQTENNFKGAVLNDKDCGKSKPKTPEEIEAAEADE